MRTGPVLPRRRLLLALHPPRAARRRLYNICQSMRTRSDSVQVRFCRAAAFCWLSIRLGLLAVAVTGGAAALIIFQNVPAGLAGAALTMMLELTNELEQGVRATASAEQDFTAVERMKHYIDVRSRFLT